MADRVVENSTEEVPDIPTIVENVTIFALDEAKEKMEQGADVIPFSALVVKGNLFIETHPGDTPDECFADARRTVQGARGADAYAFCYDGYIETDDGMKDALIAEGGVPGGETAYAIGYLYDVNSEGVPVFEPDPAYVGEAPNFMADLKEAAEYTADEIRSRYLDPDIPEE